MISRTIEIKVMFTNTGTHKHTCHSAIWYTTMSSLKTRPWCLHAGYFFLSQKKKQKKHIPNKNINKHNYKLLQKRREKSLRSRNQQVSVLRLEIKKIEQM